MADRDLEVQRSVQGAQPAASQQEGESPQNARMNVMRQRRAAMRKGEGAAAPKVDIPEGGGAPLEGKTKSTMEKKLGADLSSVRIHTGGESAGAAEKLNAQAFTVGSDVHFNAGKHDPNSKDGAHLLAHELTHVVQGQRGGVQKSAEEGREEKGEAEAEGKDGESLEVSDPEEDSEKEADAVADNVTADMGDKGVDDQGGADAKDAAGGEEASAEQEAAPEQTEEKAPEAGTKLQIGAAPAMSASVLRKVLRKKLSRSPAEAEEKKEAAPEAEAPEAEGEEKKEAAPAGEASAEAAAPEAAAPEAAAEEKKDEGVEAAGEAPEAEGEEKKEVAAKLMRSPAEPEEKKEAAPEAEAPEAEGEEKKDAAPAAEAAAPEAAAPEAAAEEKKDEGVEAAGEAPEAEGEEKKEVAAKLQRKIYRSPAEPEEKKEAAPEAAAAAAPEGEAEEKKDAGAAEAAAPDAAAPAGEAEEKKDEGVEAANEAPEAEAEEKKEVAAKRINAKHAIKRKIYRAGPQQPPAAAPKNTAPTQQEIDALPKGAVQQVGGVNNVKIENGEVVGDKGMPDSTTVQDKAKAVSEQVKAYLKPETTPEQRKAMLPAIMSLFATLRTAMSKARGEGIDIVRLRTTFEKDIGAKATSGEFAGADAAVSAMVDKAVTMIAGPQNRAVAAAQTIQQKLDVLKQDPELAKQIAAMGTKIDIGFAGAVGTSFEAVSGALSGGSLVQKCLALINFGDSFLKPKLTEKSPQVLEQIKQNLSGPEFESLEKKIKTAQEAKAGKASADKDPNATKEDKDNAAGANKEAQKQLLSDDGEFASKVNDKGSMDEKTPDLPVEALDEQSLKHLCKTKNIPTTDLTKDQMVEKLTAAGVKTSGAANMTDGAAGVTVEGMPFLQGIQANIVHPDHEWIADATKAEMPLKAGISGTTHRFLGMGKLLGVEDKPGMRLAMLGHLQAIEAHSFWEIVDASGMGAPASGKYVPFEPVGDDQMAAAAKQTIAKDAQFAADATGKEDQEAQAKRLLGTDKG